MSGLRVLIIEDEPLIQMLWESVVELSDLEIADIIEDVNQALRRIEYDDFDCAILDVNLHGIDSSAVAARLKQRSIPTIVSTGYKSTDLSDDFAGLPIVYKPFSMEATADMLKNIASTSQVC